MSSDQNALQQTSASPPSPGDRALPHYSHASQDEIDFSEVRAALHASRHLIARVSLLMGALAAASSYLMRPVFRTEVLVAPATAQNISLGGLAAQFGGLAELAGVSLGGGGNIAAAVATLKSRALTEAFIRERNLLPVLFEDDWNVSDKRWNTSDPEKIPTLWDAYRLFDRKIRSVEEDRRTGLVTLAIEWHDPKVAADWANELVRRANAKLQQDSITEGEKTIAYLDQQLAKAAAVEVRQAIYSVIEVETKNVAVAHAREEFAFKVIDPATVPRKKVKPDRLLMLLIGCLMGLTLSAAWVVLKSNDD